MDKFTKIILERINKGDIGLSGALAPEQIKYKRLYGIDSVNDTFRIIDKHGRGKKYSPLKGIELIPYFKNLPSFKPYTNGNYIFILDLNSQEPGKKESIWHVSVIDPIKAFPRLDQTEWNQFVSKNNLGKVIRSYVIDTEQYNKLKVYNPKDVTISVGGPGNNESLTDFKTRVSIEVYNQWVSDQLSLGDASIYKDEIEKIQKDENDVVVNTTNSEFQEVLNNFYIFFNLTGEPEYKNFVRTSKRADGSWDGDIGTRTKEAIAYVRSGLDPEYTGNNINDFNKRLQSEIDSIVTESVNYFKNDNIEIPLSQLFEQSLKEDFDKKKADAARIKTSVSKTKTKTSSPIIKTSAAKPNDIDMYPKILKGIGAPVTDENLKFFIAWQRAEGGSATNNPFNTTQTLQSDQDSSNYNSVGVKNYSTPKYGTAATVITLTNGYYNKILKGLRNNMGAVNIASNIDELKIWGTGKGVLRVLKSSVTVPDSKENISDVIVRQKNGFLISKSSLDIFKKDYEKYPTDTTGKELGAKKLMYGKSFKIRNGIGAYKDNQWRGYQQVNTNYVDSKGNIEPGVFSRNFSNIYWDNVKKGTPLNVKITAVKFIVGSYYGKPEPNIYTYVYCTAPNTDKGFWVPTSWITLD